MGGGDVQRLTKYIRNFRQRRRLSLIAQRVRSSFDERIDQQIRFRVSCRQSVRASPAPASQETLEPIVVRHLNLTWTRSLHPFPDNVNCNMQLAFCMSDSGVNALQSVR